MATTTIQIKKDLKERLDRFRMHSSESYNEIIDRLIEDVSVINEQTRSEIQKARKEIAAGRFKTHEQVGKELGL